MALMSSSLLRCLYLAGASREGGRPAPATPLSRRYLSRLRDGECRVNGQLVGVGTGTLKCGVVAVKHCRSPHQRYCVLLGCLAWCSC